MSTGSQQPLYEKEYWLPIIAKKAILKIKSAKIMFCFVCVEYFLNSHNNMIKI